MESYKARLDIRGFIRFSKELAEKFKLKTARLFVFPMKITAALYLFQIKALIDFGAFLLKNFIFLG